MEIVNKIVAFNEFETNLVTFKEKFDGIIYDLDNDDDMTSAMADKHSISKVRGNIDRAHKIGKADAKALCDLWDTEKNRVRGIADELYLGIDEQIKAHKQKKIDHDLALLTKVEDIRQHAIPVPDYIPKINDLTEALSNVNKISIDDSFEHLKAEASLAKTETIEKLEGKIALLEKQEAQAKADEEKRIKEQQERESRIAREAAAEAEAKAKEAEAARINSEREAAIARKDAAKLAEANRINSEQAAIDAEKRRLADLNKAEELAAIEKMAAIEKAAQDERKRIAKEKQEENIRIDAVAFQAEKKKENQQHRAKIHKEAMESLIAFIEAVGVRSNKEDLSRKIVSAIRDGVIKRLKVEY